MEDTSVPSVKNNPEQRIICNEHKCPPHDCFELHYPGRIHGKGQTAEQLAAQIKELHLHPEHKDGDGCKEARAEEKAKIAAALQGTIYLP